MADGANPEMSQQKKDGAIDSKVEDSKVEEPTKPAV